MRKNKWGNVIRVIILFISTGIILHDLYMLTIHNFFSEDMFRFTWLGFITFIISIVVAFVMYDDLKEQTKSVSNTGTVRYTNK